MKKIKVLAAVLGFAFILISCGSEENDVNIEKINDGDGTFVDHHIKSEEELMQIAEKKGCPALYYGKVIPVDLLGEGETEQLFVAVKKVEETDSFDVCYINPDSGDVIMVGAPTEGLRYFLEKVLPELKGTTPGTYDSFPWGTNLPYLGSMQVSCGYGCGAHTQANGIFNSLDFNLAGAKDCGRPIAAPFSGFVADTSLNSSLTNGLGWQIIIQGGSAGNQKTYFNRDGHLQSQSVLKPGWWVYRGQTIGYIGTTGSSTGCHIHAEIWRGQRSGKYLSGETLPWSGWPGINDRVDSYDGVNGSRCYKSENIGSSGVSCP